MLICYQGKPQRELLKPSFFYFAAYCNINADKWNWLPLDQRTLRALKGSSFLVIPWMQFCLFKYDSARTICLHEHRLTDQSWHI